MDFLNGLPLSWLDFWAAALGLFGLYWLLRLGQRVLNNLPWSNSILSRIKDGIRFLLAVFEPASILLLGGIFVMISPLLHGIIAGVLLLGGFGHLRNYISGKLLQVDGAISTGKRLLAEGHKGMITEQGRLGLKLRTASGLQFINYNTLMTKGYQLLPSEEIGGYYHLVLEGREDHPVSNSDLFDLLASSPFLDWSHRPEISTTADHPNRLHARVLVKDEGYLHDLLALLEEQGFKTKISKK